MRFTADGRSFSGRVARVSPTIDPASRSVAVYVTVQNPNGVLKGNTFATGQVVVNTVNDALEKRMAARKMLTNASYFAFTATPKNKTLEIFGDPLPAAAAAFVNSTFGHSFEYDDRNPLFNAHPGPELVPSLMAIGEREHISGRAYVTAFVAAYEVMDVPMVYQGPEAGMVTGVGEPPPKRG